MTDLNECRIIDLRKITDSTRGSLTVVEQEQDIHFEIKRVYWIYDVPSGESRGGHAHTRLQQLLVPVSGSFKVVLDNGRQTKEVLLNHPWQGLLIVSGVWRTLEDFSSGAVCMCLASDHYEESEYIREYDDFKALYTE